MIINMIYKNNYKKIGQKTKTIKGSRTEPGTNKTFTEAITKAL